MSADGNRQNGRKRKSVGGRGALDEPVGRHPLAPGVRTVRGWAICDPPMSSAVLRVDGEPIATARIGLPRRTLAARSKAPIAELCGFEALADLTAWAATGADLDIEVTRLDGTTYVLDALRVPEWDPLADVEETALWSPSWDAAPPGENPQRRVLVFSHDLAPYGAQRRMLDYLSALVGLTDRQPSLQFEVVAQYDGPLRGELAALGIPVHISGPDGRQSAAEYELAVERAAELIAAVDCDLIWANTLVSFGAVDAATRIGVPSFWFVHEGLEPVQFWAPEAAAGRIGPHAYGRFRAALRSATMVACVARAARRAFQPYRDRSIALVPNSIDLGAVREYRSSHDRQEARARLGFGDLDRLVLSVAPVVPHKGQALLAQAFATLLESHPRTVCVMIGDIGHPYAAGISAYVGKLGIADRIRVLPPVEDVYEWFLAADLFVLPSDEEALASVVLEAMAFEVPVVSTDIAGMPEAVEDGRTGFLARRRDVAALADALHRALSLYPTVFRTVCAEAWERVHAAHDVSVQAGTVQALLTALADPSDVWEREAAPEPEIGLDVALAIARDLAAAGLDTASVLHTGRGADVGFALAALGFAVTTVDPDVGGLADWRRLRRGAANSGTRVPRTSRATLSQHLRDEPTVYDAVLLFSGWPLRFSADVDALAEAIVMIAGHAGRAYIGAYAASDSGMWSEALQRVLSARKAGSRLVQVAPTVDLVGEEVALYRIDLPSGHQTGEPA